MYNKVLMNLHRLYGAGVKSATNTINFEFFLDSHQVIKYT